MTMRRGFSIIEMIGLMAFIPAVTFLLTELFRPLLTEIPRSAELVQEYTSLVDALEKIQEDLDRAVALPLPSAARRAGDDVLLVELPEGTVAYELGPGTLTRYGPAEAPADKQGSRMTWSLPNTRIQWRLWQSNQAAYAVEIRSHIEHKLRNRTRKKMANSRVYFVGAL